jgi:putative transposase
MKTPTSMLRLKGFRFPSKIIAYAVRAYHRFAMSTADVGDLLAERGVIVSREAIRLWVNRVGSYFANCVRRDRPRPNGKRHLDEVVNSTRGKRHWLWRAIDADKDVLDIFVQTQRNAKAAKRFPERLITQVGEPRIVITDKAAISSRSKHWHQTLTTAPLKGLNNVIEGWHRPTRKREKIFSRFKSHRRAQRFLSAHDQINLIFRPRRFQLTANSYCHARADAFSLWAEYTMEMVA